MIHGCQNVWTREAAVLLYLRLLSSALCIVFLWMITSEFMPSSPQTYQNSYFVPPTPHSPLKRILLATVRNKIADCIFVSMGGYECHMHVPTHLRRLVRINVNLAMYYHADSIYYDKCCLIRIHYNSSMPVTKYNTHNDQYTVNTSHFQLLHATCTCRCTLQYLSYSRGACY